MSNKKHPLEFYARGNPFNTGDPFIKYYQTIQEEEKSDMTSEEETTNLVNPEGSTTDKNHEEPTEEEETDATDNQILETIREDLTNAINHLRETKNNLMKLGADNSNATLAFAKDEAEKELEDLIEFSEKLEDSFDTIEEYLQKPKEKPTK